MLSSVRPDPASLNMSRIPDREGVKSHRYVRECFDCECFDSEYVSQYSVVGWLRKDEHIDRNIIISIRALVD